MSCWFDVFSMKRFFFFFANKRKMQSDFIDHIHLSFSSHTHIHDLDIYIFLATQWISFITQSIDSLPWICLVMNTDGRVGILSWICNFFIHGLVNKFRQKEENNRYREIYIRRKTGTKIRLIYSCVFVNHSFSLNRPDIDEWVRAYVAWIFSIA